jgi:hypothetical protein
MNVQNMFLKGVSNVNVTRKIREGISKLNVANFFGGN